MFVRFAARAAGQVGFVALAARQLEVSNFAEFAPALLLISLAFPFTEQGAALSVIEMPVLSRAALGETQAAALWFGIGLAITGVAFAASMPVAIVGDRTAFTVASLVLPANAAGSVALGRLRRGEQFRSLAKLEILAAVWNFFAGLSMVVLLQGPAALAAAFLSYHIFVAVGCVIVAQRNLSAFWVYRRPSPAALRRNLQIAGAGVGAWLSAIADTTVAVWSLGPSAVAAYTRGNSLVQSSLGGVMSAGYQASAPGLARAHRSNDRYDERFRQFVGEQVEIGATLAAVVMLLAAPLSQVVFPGWDIVETLFRVLPIGWLIRSVSIAVVADLEARGKFADAATTRVVGALFSWSAALAWWVFDGEDAANLAFTWIAAEAVQLGIVSLRARRVSAVVRSLPRSTATVFAVVLTLGGVAPIVQALVATVALIVLLRPDGPVAALIAT